ncbi:serine/threonine-protein kinase [Nocardia sp. NPDC127579]|uniref:serine/threonine-protein kinase n=1 Tax=Nocardia sp. NPDC127579 TaxID=3345402 RepID=UPI0036297BA4
MCANELPSGSIFAGYLIERRLGTGGMGTVYLAEDPEVSMKVALKVMRDPRSRPVYAAQFRREAELAANLQHPNIVDVKGFGDEGGVLWLAMQYVPGGDLAGLIEANPDGVEPQRAVRLIAEAAKALDHAHRNRVIHRDVKPANIFLAADHGDAEWVLVGDFGIARSTETDSTRTMTGYWAYTAPYAPPEQRAGLPVDYSADVHALGVTLYELLTGRQPSALPGTDTDRVSPAMREVIAKATAADPADRYASCGELATAAAATLRGSTGRAAILRRATRHRRGLVAALVAAALLTTALSLALRASPNGEVPGTSSATTIPGLISGRCHFSVEVPVGDGSHAIVPSTRDGSRICILSLIDSRSGEQGRFAEPIEGVVVLHTALRGCYQRENADGTGIYGEGTKADLRYVQDASNVDQDGVFGPKTSAAMLWPTYDAGGNQVGCARIPLP